jgi:hypothetical protein
MLAVSTARMGSCKTSGMGNGVCESWLHGQVLCPGEPGHRIIAFQV